MMARDIPHHQQAVSGKFQSIALRAISTNDDMRRQGEGSGIARIPRPIAGNGAAIDAQVDARDHRCVV